jgi:uncharacterized protein (DUF1778 family)
MMMRLPSIPPLLAFSLSQRDVIYVMSALSVPAQPQERLLAIEAWGF